LEAAFARISILPLPIAGVPSMPLECGYTDIPPYDDSVGEFGNSGIRLASYPDAYGDDPYVDMPYDDEYSDNDEE
jgi:hypothetical protein